MARPKGSGVIDVNVRFERSIVPEPNSGCWLWAGSVDHAGYGQLFIQKGVTARAHVYSYERQNNIKVVRGQDVCHKCDTPPCVNPAHLFLGSRKDNMQDSKRKGRTLSGERNNMAKLTRAKVREIKILIADGRRKEDIAAVYCVHESTIYRIARGETWSD